MFSMSERTFVLIIEIVLAITVLIPTAVAFLTGAPWVPTPLARVKKMLELGNIKPGDRVYELGTGDGRLVHLAKKLHKADAIGLELSPIIFALAKIRGFFVRSKAKVLLRDFRYYNMGDAKVLFFYLLPDILKNMREKWIAELKPGTKIISYAFSIEGWEPVYIEAKDPAKNLSKILVYEVPQSYKKYQAESAKKKTA